MTLLDPKFAKVVALWRSTQHDGEKASARARAEEMAIAAGMTFDEALAEIKKPAPKPAWTNIFAGFDDWMEEKEPGYKARCAAEQAERRRQNAEKRTAVVAKYGSAEAALAPCDREKLILAAVAPWRKARRRPYQRWTYTLDGWNGYGFQREDMPAHVLAAISTAYPLPKTFSEAKAEHDHWRMRDDELELILDKSGLGLGDVALDMVAGVRAEIVRDLVAKDMPVFTLEDLHARFAVYRAWENHDETIEEALFRDLTAMVETQHLSNPSIPSVAAPADASNRNDGAIRAALDADPSRSDRNVARSCKCSPTTVGKIRRTMGLGGVPRSVQRGGQMYQASFAFEERR